ncbi:MAG: PTS lactose transporter subunit IIB [Chloroflexi bacterium]|nr:PTS lactose transporter subunit IIB [Actinomycetota bacterium]MQC48532.1 PTS lactose transporter subunit IIB [Chloroflexota bacterium]
MGNSVAASEVRTIYIACEAGFGSSLMVTNQLKKLLKKAGVSGVAVKHSPAVSVPADAQVIVVHSRLEAVARRCAPNAVTLPFTNFMSIPAFDIIVTALTTDGMIAERGA